MFLRFCSSSIRCYLLAILCLCIPAHALDDPFAPKNQNLSQSPLTVGNAIAPQDDFLPVDQAFIPNYSIEQGKLLLRWTIADAYYLYEERFKFRTDGLDLVPNYTPGKMKYDELFERETMVHYGAVTASFDLNGIKEPFQLKLEYQGCADAGLCYPPQKKILSVDPVKALAVEEVATGSATDLTSDLKPSRLTANPSQAKDSTAPSPETNWLWQAILLAMLGGVILNLMPCVFPVLSIKVMSLATADRSRLTVHGWAYTLGVVASFVAFAAILLVARKGGEAIGWGFQLQSPGLIAALAYLFFIMGLSMSGLINIGGSLMGAGQTLTQQSGLGGSFFTGVLAAVVAGPCTAPFMGAALGFALTQPAVICLAVFAALGFGMALPLLLLCYLPALANRLPRPGHWMDTLKQFLAFPLYLSAIWLLWVYGRQTNVNGMAALAAGALLIAFSCWLWTRHAKGSWYWLNRLLIAASWIIAIALPLQIEKSAQSVESTGRWQPYSAELLASLRSQGRPVFVNLTADWCLTCLANERIALHTATVNETLDGLNAATLKGDWTNADPEITQLLREYNRSGVPLYLWFPSGATSKGVILPQLLTPDVVVSYISPAK